VQGRLRREFLSVTIDSDCAHCSKPLRITIDSDLNYRAEEDGCEPIVFVPHVDFSAIEDKCIINAF